MGRAQRFSIEQIRDIQKMLRVLQPQKRGKTWAEVVELLAGDIRKAMEKGHSPADIRGILAGEGIQASVSSLKTLHGQAHGDPSQTDLPVPKSEVKGRPALARMLVGNTPPKMLMMMNQEGCDDCRKNFTVDFVSASRGKTARLQL
jgi:hypothetical protein